MKRRPGFLQHMRLDDHTCNQLALKESDDEKN